MEELKSNAKNKKVFKYILHIFEMRMHSPRDTNIQSITILKYFSIERAKKL